MQHYSDETWVDFVRGVGPADATKALASHLETGCADCGATLALWTGLRTAAANDSQYSPSAELMRRLTLEFTTRYSPKSAEMTLAKLVFDSFGQPLPAGVRSGAVAARQLVYEVEGLSVDLRVEKDLQSKKICAVGQVLDRKIPRALLCQGAVILWTAQGYPMMETNPNEYGEFQLEFEAQEQLRLSIEMTGRSPFRIALPELD